MQHVLWYCKQEFISVVDNELRNNGKINHLSSFVMFVKLTTDESLAEFDRGKQTGDGEERRVDRLQPGNSLCEQDGVPAHTSRCHQNSARRGWHGRRESFQHGHQQVWFSEIVIEDSFRFFRLGRSKYLRWVPNSVCPCSAADSDSMDGESGFEDPDINEVGATVAKFILKFIDKVSVESGVSSEHNKSLHQMVPGLWPLWDNACFSACAIMIMFYHVILLEMFLLFNIVRCYLFSRCDWYAPGDIGSHSSGNNETSSNAKGRGLLSMN